MTEQNTEGKAPETLNRVRTSDFVERYANNVRFEASEWDMKMQFGLLDQSTSPTSVREHMALNVSWEQAKLMAYFLYVNVVFHELTRRPISLSDSVQPVAVETIMDATGLSSDPNAQAVLARINRLKAELFK